MSDYICPCGHDRLNHDKDGCVQCVCKKTYMDMRGKGRKGR